MLAVADNQFMRKAVTKYGMSTPTSFARRFIAGETLDEAIDAVRELNNDGIAATLDLLGENVTSVEESRRARDQFLHILDRIHKAGVDSNVSVKLTQMGLDIGDDVCTENMMAILLRAKEYHNFVRIDMEGSDYTQRTIDIFQHLFERVSSNVGIVLQAYLYRTEFDVIAMNRLGARIRLCKGAYLEPETVAFRKKKFTDSNYIRCLEMILKKGTHPAIATHDEKIIAYAREFVEKNGIAKDRFEFQMLYGIRRDIQKQLVRDGYQIRVYVPFGTEWFPYFSRRLGERTGNIVFIVKNLYRDSLDEKGSI